MTFKILANILGLNTKPSPLGNNLNGGNPHSTKFTSALNSQRSQPHHGTSQVPSNPVGSYQYNAFLNNGHIGPASSAAPSQSYNPLVRGSTSGGHHSTHTGGAYGGYPQPAPPQHVPSENKGIFGLFEGLIQKKLAILTLPFQLFGGLLGKKSGGLFGNLLGGLFGKK